MRPNNYSTGFILASGLLSFAIDCRLPLQGARLAGITEVTESLQNISDILKGIHSFFSSLSNISVISNVIGPETVILLAATLALGVLIDKRKKD